MVVPPKVRVTHLRSPKRGDLVVEEIKAWIAEQRLAPGDRLPKEDELQALFGVSKGTAREALKSLEVQGLVSVSTGPSGGATIGEVPLERTLQLLQNYLFFRELSVAQIYAVRRIRQAPSRPWSSARRTCTSMTCWPTPIPMCCCVSCAR